MQRLIERVRRAASSELPALVRGETGTGKELVVRALHQLGPRRSGPFVSLNCAAVSPELLERELFGHVRGAYTGAYETRGGLFEAADGGILFLDEIGDATPQFQARLLRVLGEKAIRRIGDTRLQPVDVRVVAATNRRLEQAVQEGTFRQDLYYRLRGEEILLPPLRQRREEIPFLVHHALQHWARRRDKEIPAITCRAVKALQACDWPGNVRELIYELERAAGEANGRPITPGDLSVDWKEKRAPVATGEEEIQRITRALETAGGNRSEAARRLGISRVTLYRKIHRLGLPIRAVLSRFFISFSVPYLISSIRRTCENPSSPIPPVNR